MPLWIIIITWITRLVLLLLIALSVWSVKVILDRMKFFRNEEEMDFFTLLAAARSGSRESLKKWATENYFRGRLLKGLLNSYGDSGISDGYAHTLDRNFQATLKQERRAIEEGLTVLGSLGSNAPFIGLFGTVLGVIQAFGALSVQQGNMAVVMLSISEALVATAIGLFVAIPATVAYNYFLRKIRLLVADGETLRDVLASKAAR